MVHSLGWEDPLEDYTETHSSTLAWRIPWTEEPGRLRSIGSQKIRHDWSNLVHVRTHTHTHTHTHNLYVHSSTFKVLKNNAGCRKERWQNPVSSESLTVVDRKVLILITWDKIVNSIESCFWLLCFKSSYILFPPPVLRQLHWCCFPVSWDISGSSLFLSCLQFCPMYAVLHARELYPTTPLLLPL